MTRVAVRIGYRGEGFSGSQIQPNAITVEGEILKALTEISDWSQDDFNLKMASRTDAGVSASFNVAVFHTPFNNLNKMLTALNAVCESVYFISAVFVNDDFNPRRAVSRKYRYTAPADGINIEKAKKCANFFVGLHDFKRFCKPDGKPTVCSIDDIQVYEKNNTLVMEFVAERFLWNMIRRISSAIISVAKGHSDISEVNNALNGEDRTFGLAPASGLVLIDITYNNIKFDEFDIPSLKKKIEKGIFNAEIQSSFFKSL